MRKRHEHFTALNVPRQNPLVLLVEVCLKESKAFKSGEGKMVKG
jgi:hypothetical protein